MRRLINLLAIALACLTGPINARAQPSPKPGPEIQKLAAMVGRFTNEGEVKAGALAKYLSDHTNWIDGLWPHDEGIIGVSIEVADLGKARQLAESGTGRKLETYKGSYGTSFLLPPEVTHGVWIEMFQPAESSR